MKLDELHPLLEVLGLSGMKIHLESIMNKIDDKAKPEGYQALRELLEVEKEYKKSRSLNYRLHLAKFPTIKLLADTKQATLVANIEMKEIIARRENIMFIGSSGSGKTHLATGLGYQAIENGYRVKFYTLNDLATQLLNARQHNYELQFMQMIRRFQLLVIDELGYVPIKSEASPLLFELFSKLYEQVSLLITTHLRFEEWGNMFGDAKATKAIIDRLTHHCKIIETGNKSFRVNESHGGTAQ